MKTTIRLLTLFLRYVSLALAIVASGSSAAAQSNNEMSALASRSAIVVLGTVTNVEASEEPMLAPTSSTVVIKVEKMYAGSELAGDQTGRTATVILSKPGGMKVGAKAIFFGNPRFIGKTITIADEGELPESSGDVKGVQALTPALHERSDAPVRARLNMAQTVFRGTVESVRPLQVESRDKEASQRNEHDPEWQVAMVRVASGMRGAEKGSVIPVVFAASRDIMWFNSPKPKPGEEKLFIAHRPQESEASLLRAASVSSFVEKEHPVFVTDPFDVLPPSDEKRVAELLKKKEVH
jgi:hypothetical protein